MDTDPLELEYNQMMFVSATNHGCGRSNDSVYGAPRVSPCTHVERANSEDPRDSLTVARGVLVSDGPEDHIGKGDQLAQFGSNGASVRRATAAKTFPEKLMSLLSKSRSDSEIAESIAWLPHGRSFEVCNPDKFSKDILPTYFKQAKFSSFTRKLYRWGFRHITKGPDANSFYHELFQRDNSGLCLNMFCTYSDGVVRNKRAKMKSKNEGASCQGRYPSVSIDCGHVSNAHLSERSMGSNMNDYLDDIAQGPNGAPTIEMQLQIQKLHLQKLEMQQMQLQLHRMQMQIQMNAKMMGVSAPDVQGSDLHQPTRMAPDDFSCMDQPEEDMWQRNATGAPHTLNMGNMIAPHNIREDRLQSLNSNVMGEHGLMKTPGVHHMQPFHDPVEKSWNFDYPKKVVSNDSDVMPQQAYIAKLRQCMGNGNLSMGGRNSAVA